MIVFFVRGCSVFHRDELSISNNPGKPKSVFPRAGDGLVVARVGVTPHARSRIVPEDTLDGFHGLIQRRSFDIAKNVFQVHRVAADGVLLSGKKLLRSWFAELAVSRVYSKRKFQPQEIQ